MAPITASQLIQRANAVAAEFDFTPEQVNASVAEYLRLMDIGLQNDNQAMAMIPTYVTSVPNGTEKGVYLAVDLGGTNFRVCSITLNGDSTFQLVQAKNAIPKELMTGTAHELFSFLAARIKDFVQEHHADHFEEDKEHHLRLGFTFSFPVDQKGINKGYLIRWTKGFDIKDAIGKDVCHLLQTEIDALGLPVIVAALVNDTVGTLMARSYTSPGKSGTLLGAIFGTGTNGAYVEKLHRITKLTASEEAIAAYGEYDKSTGEMVVNTEWGAFDNAMRILPDTPYDRQLDENSVNPGFQMFEKRVSGMFLGEILRNALLFLRDDAGLFASTESKPVTIKENANIFQPWSIDTAFLSNVEADSSEGWTRTRELIESELGISGASEEDAEAVRIVARAIGRRSARLSAIPIAAIVISTKLREEQKDDEGVGLSEVETGLARLRLGHGRRASIVRSVIDSLLSVVDRVRASVTPSIAPVVDAPQPGAPTSKKSSRRNSKVSTTPRRNSKASTPPRQSSKTSTPPRRDSKSAAKTVSGDEDNVIDIGVDGSVVEYYPGFEKYLREALIEVKEIGLNVEQRLRIGVAKDGSGVGAALIALVASI